MASGMTRVLWLGGILGAAFAAVVACGGEDDTSDDGGEQAPTCQRLAEDDDQCAATPNTPAFHVCETDEQVAPSDDCVPAGDGDYCCPIAGSGGTGGATPMGSGGDGGDTTSGAWWKPEAGVTWDWQLLDAGDLDVSRNVEVYDLDWEVPASVVDGLRSRGIRVLCYVSVGSYEDWRPDAADFPADVLGNEYPGWAGERFIDIRADSVREIIEQRFDVCAEKGFDGIEPDNQDSFETNTGFPLTEANGLEFAQWLADQAHTRGLAIVQKNTSELDLVDLYDGALTEDCFVDDWCEDFLPYTAAGKPVFMAEYTDTDVDFAAACTWASENGFSPILKDRDLTTEFEACR